MKDCPCEWAKARLDYANELADEVRQLRTKIAALEANGTVAPHQKASIGTYRVWIDCLHAGEEKAAIEINATSAEEAALEWTARYDRCTRNPNDYGPDYYGLAHNEDDISVLVRAPNGRVTRWVVSGGWTPRYSAKRRELCSLGKKIWAPK